MADANDEVPNAQDAAARAAAAKRAKAASDEQAIEKGVEVVAEVADAVSHSKSPMASLVVMVVTLLTGGGVAFGGWNASNAITAQVTELTKKVDKLTEELTETRKALEAMRSETTASVAKATAERHEDRIRKLEDQAQASILERTQLKLELEALKKAQGK